VTPDSAPGAPPGARGRAVDLSAIRRTDMVLDLLAGRRLPRPHSLGDRALVLLAGLTADTDDVPLPSRPPSVPARPGGAGFPGDPGYAGGRGLASGLGHSHGPSHAHGLSRAHGLGHAGGPGQVHGLGHASGLGQAGGLGQASGPGEVRGLGQAGGRCQASGAGRDSRPGTVIRLGTASGTGATDDRRWAGSAARLPGPGRRVLGPGRRVPRAGHRVPGRGHRWQVAVRLPGRPRQGAGGWARSLAAVMSFIAAMAVAAGLLVAGMFTRLGDGHHR
jgi:hypothetical protein